MCPWPWATATSDVRRVNCLSIGATVSGESERECVGWKASGDWEASERWAVVPSLISGRECARFSLFLSERIDNWPKKDKAFLKGQMQTHLPLLNKAF